jgi:hypothetical protein
LKPPSRNPDHRPRLKPLGQPRAVDVRTDEHGEPVHVRLPGRTARRVAVVRERWRIDDEWWRQSISREYRIVVLDDGKVITLYEDLSEGTWFVQRA